MAFSNNYIYMEVKQGPDLRYLRRANWRGRFFGIYGFIEPDLETHCEKIGFFGIYGFIEPDLETRCEKIEIS